MIKILGPTLSRDKMILLTFFREQNYEVFKKEGKKSEQNFFREQMEKKSRATPFCEQNMVIFQIFSDAMMISDRFHDSQSIIIYRLLSTQLDGYISYIFNFIYMLKNEYIEIPFLDRP